VKPEPEYYVDRQLIYFPFASNKNGQVRNRNIEWCGQKPDMSQHNIKANSSREQVGLFVGMLALALVRHTRTNLRCIA